jgi:hypothetical protein
MWVCGGVRMYVLYMRSFYFIFILNNKLLAGWLAVFLVF